MKKTDFDQELINTLRSLKTEENVNPSVIFRENTRTRLMNLISDGTSAPEDKHAFVFFRNPAFAFKTVGIMFLILLILSTGTILAAQSSNPKNTLYPVKLASEEVALALSPASLKGSVAVEIAKRRGDEITLQQKTDSKSEIKQGLETYRESINQAKILIPSNNQHLSSELKNEESNLDELTHQYENSKESENRNNNEQKVKGASDSNNNQSEQNSKQNNSATPIPTQDTGSEKNSEGTRIQNSPSDNIDKTIQEIKNSTEDNLQFLTATPNPEKN